jgi:hypothetical protein
VIPVVSFGGRIEGRQAAVVRCWQLTATAGKRMVRNLIVAHVVKYITIYGTPYGKSGVYRYPSPFHLVSERYV